MFKEPKFKDNFDSTPKIKSSHTPGQEFNWDTYKIMYNATDKAGNMASCSYNLQVGREYHMNLLKTQYQPWCIACVPLYSIYFEFL